MFFLSDGDHWLVVSMTRPHYVDFLCSSASQPQEFPHIMARLRETNRKIYQFPEKLQSSALTTSCGSWCLFIFYLISRYFTPQEILQHFFTPSSSSSPLFPSLLNTGLKRDVFITHVIRYLFPNLLSFSAAQLLLDPEFLEEQKDEDEKCLSQQPSFSRT